MGYKYRNDGTPDHVDSDNSDSIPTPQLATQSDTTDLKKKIKAQRDSMDAELSFPSGKKKLSASDYGVIDNRMNKVQSLEYDLNKERTTNRDKAMEAEYQKNKAKGKKP